MIIPVKLWVSFSAWLQGCSAKDLMGERVGPLMTVVVGKFGSQMVLQEIDMNL